jgi:hypothetical protein
MVLEQKQAMEQIEDPEIKPHIYSYLIFNKGAKEIH